MSTLANSHSAPHSAGENTGAGGGGIKGDTITVLCPHSSHAIQGMDTKGGPIQHVKDNLKALLAQQYFASGEISKPARRGVQARLGLIGLCGLLGLVTLVS